MWGSPETRCQGPRCFCRLFSHWGGHSGAIICGHQDKVCKESRFLICSLRTPDAWGLSKSILVLAELARITHGSCTRGLSVAGRTRFAHLSCWVTKPAPCLSIDVDLRCGTASYSLFKVCRSSTNDGKSSFGTYCFVSFSQNLVLTSNQCSSFGLYFAASAVEQWSRYQMH